MIEADSFWSMSLLLDGIQDNYTFAQPGIQTKVTQLKELVQRIDGELWGTDGCGGGGGGEDWWDGWMGWGGLRCEGRICRVGHVGREERLENVKKPTQWSGTRAAAVMATRSMI